MLTSVTYAQVCNIEIYMSNHIYPDTSLHLPVFHREPPRPRWSTATAVVHREIDFPITPAVLTLCHRDFIIMETPLDHGDCRVAQRFY